MQQNRIIWLYGRPCSGKTTIGERLTALFSEEGEKVMFIDADFLRSGLNRDLGYSLEDRFENIRRASEMAAFIALKGEITVICAFITPLIGMRELAKSIADRNGVPFFPVYVDTPLEECMVRDVKGHYNSAKKGIMAHFTGVSSPFEEPAEDEIRISTLKNDPAECARMIISRVRAGLL